MVLKSPQRPKGGFYDLRLACLLGGGASLGGGAQLEEARPQGQQHREHPYSTAPLALFPPWVTDKVTFAPL